MKSWCQTSRRTVVLGLAWGTLVWAVGCSRQLAVPGSAKTGDSGQLPFERVSDGSGISPTAAFASESVPVGTEFTVQLRLVLSSADSRAGDTFEALLDDPVVVVGKTVVPQSTLVTGRVVAAKAAAGRHDPGYLRLVLASLALNGKSIPLQTSSIFAKGGLYEKRSQPATARGSEPDNQSTAVGTVLDSATGSQPSRDRNRGDVRFSTGHRFTFRLAQPLHLPN
jgi:hypothetical protein